MALSDNAIGFFLEAEDTTLSSTLAKATTNYEKYTKALEGFNKRAFNSTGKGLRQVEELVKAVTDLPTATERAMKTASAKIGKTLKPITQKVDLAITVSSKSKLRRAVGEAVTEAMTGARVRLTATMPERRLAAFDNALGLRAQYQQQTQPPDMKGRIHPLKKFAEGGVVDGPPGLDKVFAMLTKGEIVLPADVSKRMLKLGESAAGANQIDEKKLNVLVNLTAQYGDELAPVAKGLGMIAANLDNIADVTQGRLGAAMIQSVERMEDLKDEGKDNEGVFEKLFGKILGPARFLAISEGVKSVQETLRGLQAGAGSAFTTLGGDEIGSGIDSINQMNQFLGVSRAELVEIKVRAGQVAKEVDGISFDELGFGLKTAAELGIRDQDILFRLAKTSALAAKGLDVASESATKLGFELTESLNVSQAGFEATLGTMSQLSDATSGFNISAGKLFAQTEADVAVLNTSLQKLDDEGTQRLIGSFNQMGAVLESNFIDGAAEIRQVLAKAFEGGPENMEAIASATQLTGLAQDELRAKLLSGDLEGIFDRIGEQVQGLNPDQIKALSSQVGVASDDLGRFGSSIDAINAGFEKSKTRIAQTGEGMEILETRATNNRTAFEQLQETFTDNVAAMSVFGVSGAEVLDFFKELNPLSLLAVASLGKTAFSAIGAAKGFLGLGGAGGVAGQTMSSVGALSKGLLPVLGKVALAAGPLLIVAGAAAFVTKKIVDLSDEVVAANAIANKGEKAALTDFGAIGADIMRVKKNIKRVQAQVDIDEAAGKEANPNAIKLLERYNGQLADLEARSKGMVDAARERKRVMGVTQPGMAPPVPGADIAAVLADMPVGTDPGGTEDRLDQNNQLMAQLVALQTELVQQGRAAPAANASPATQGPSLGVSPFGQAVAGGEL